MKKSLTQDLSWQVLFLLGVIGIILGRLLGDALGAVLGVLGDIFFLLGVVDFVVLKRKQTKDSAISTQEPEDKHTPMLFAIGMVLLLILMSDILWRGAQRTLYAGPY